MVANPRLVVAAVCCALLAGASARADEPQPASPEKIVIIPYVGIDADEVVKVARSEGYTNVARTPLFNAVVVWGTEEEVFRMVFALSPL